MRTLLLKPVVALQQAKWRMEDRGATAVEYGLLVAAIAAVIIVVVVALGGKIQAAFTDVNTNMP